MNRVIEQLKTQLEAWKVAESKVSTGDTSGDFMGVSGKAWASLETVHQNALLAISADDLAVIGGKDFDLPADAEEKLRNVKNAPEIVIIEGLTHPLVDLDQDPTVLSEALVDIIIQKLKDPN
jgi:pimeloyl-ACP methyl ester carboxylesterase